MTKRTGQIGEIGSEQRIRFVGAAGKVEHVRHIGIKSQFVAPGTQRLIENGRPRKQLVHICHLTYVPSGQVLIKLIGALELTYPEVSISKDSCRELDHLTL